MNPCASDGSRQPVLPLRDFQSTVKQRYKQKIESDIAEENRCSREKNHECDAQPDDRQQQQPAGAPFERIDRPWAQKIEPAKP